ncbi:Hypothetical predicted protein [Paramuricea clavata]|uniref:Uncharacterized protein n=1 Tax=Paramuricea clavata TaxID=317549 RepID=A0A7D9KA58_PARCT|nr:Hypothetical predicted protein [Paramuricea clavata]
MTMLRRKVYFLFFVSAAIVILYGFIWTKSVVNNSYNAPPEKEESGIHVITNYPLMTEKPWNEGQTDTNRSRLWQRQEEIEETLQKNLNHTLVTAVHLLVDQPSAEQRLSEQNFHNKHKIFVHRINALPKYRDFFDYVNDRLQNQLVVMLNMDIYLGEGFEMLNKTFLVEYNTSYVLTRHGRQEKMCNMAGRPGYCGVSFIGSHDAYIFVLTQPLEESVLVELDYYMNVYGAENKLVWVLRNKMKRRLLNPCKYLKTYHNHCVDIIGNARTRINRNGKSGVVGPSGLYE